MIEVERGGSANSSSVSSMTLNNSVRTVIFPSRVLSKLLSADMNKTYYFKNLFISLVLTVLAMVIWFQENAYSQKENLYFSLIVISSAFLFPLSKKLIERFFLSFTTPDFWTRGLFMETPGKNGLYALFWLSSMATAIPLGGAYLIYLAINKWPDYGVPTKQQDR